MGFLQIDQKMTRGEEIGIKHPTCQHFYLAIGCMIFNIWNPSLESGMDNAKSYFPTFLAHIHL